MSDQLSTDTPAGPRSTGRVWIGYVVVALLAFVAGFGVSNLTEPDEETVVPQAAPESSAEPTATPTASPRPTLSRRPTPTPTTTTPAGISTALPGQSLSFGVGTRPFGTIKVESVERYTEPRADYSDPPANGQYVLVVFTIKADDAATEPYHITPGDFYVRNAAGTRWDQSAGNGFSESPDESLDYIDLNAGEQVQAPLVFDAGADVMELVYAPDGRSIGVWTIP